MDSTPGDDMPVTTRRQQRAAAGARNRVSRRAFLGYSGATLAVLSVPGCRFGGDDAEALDALADALTIDVGTLPPPSITLAVQRPEDLVDLRFSFVNLSVDAKRTKATRVASPALIVITLPPQHLGERSFHAASLVRVSRHSPSSRSA